MVDYLSRAAARATLRPAYLAWHVSAAAIVAALGCTPHQAALLQLCRPPRPGCWAADVAELARYLALDTAALAAFLAGVLCTDAGGPAV